MRFANAEIIINVLNESVVRKFREELDEERARLRILSQIKIRVRVVKSRFFIVLSVFSLINDVLEVLASERGFRRVDVTAEREMRVSGEKLRFIAINR